MTRDLGALTEEVERAYTAYTPRAAALLARASQFLPGGDTRQQAFVLPHPPSLASGRGPRVIDVDGNELIDLTNAWSALVLGHAHPDVVDAVARQASMGTLHTFPHPLLGEHAALLVDRFPSIELVRYANSGTEANLLAVAAARAVTGRPALVLVEGGYHSSYDVAELGGSAPPDAAAAAAAATIRIPLDDVDAARTVFAEQGHRIAATLVEPMLGPAGMRPASPEFLTALRQLTREHGALLIFDEVITARLSTGGLQQLVGVEPDLTTLGKVIGGGLPLAAVGGAAAVMRRFAPTEANRLRHSGTFTANPLALAAGRAALGLMTADLLTELNGTGDDLRRRLEEVTARRGVKVTVSGMGSLLNLHAPVEGRDDAELLRCIFLALYVRGVLVAPRGFIALSAATDETDLAAVVDAFDDALAMVVELAPARVA
jgi:glutamate-1-semialdehyde 2,1-aminomutase